MTTILSTDDQRKQKRRLEIVPIATRLFASLGYNECEMERVANELKIAKGTLYLYFAGKQELFFACVDRGMQELQTALDAAVHGDENPFRCSAKSIWAFLQFFDTHPEQIELLIQERAIFRDRARPTFFAYRDTRRARWRDLYQGLIDSGRLRSDLPVDDLLDTMGNLLYGTMFTNYFAGRSVPLCQQYQAVVEVVFRGVLSDSERGQFTLGSPADWKHSTAACSGQPAAE